MFCYQISVTTISKSPLQKIKGWLNMVIFGGAKFKKLCKFINFFVTKKVGCEKIYVLLFSVYSLIEAKFVIEFWKEQKSTKIFLKSIELTSWRIHACSGWAQLASPAHLESLARSVKETNGDIQFPKWFILSFISSLSYF